MIIDVRQHRKKSSLARRQMKTEEYPVIEGFHSIESQAIRNRWGVPGESMKDVMQHQVDLATGERSSGKEKIGAARNLITMVAHDRQEEVNSARSNINIAGSVVIGTDALSAAIRDRMARRAANQCAETGSDGCFEIAGSVEPESGGDDEPDRPAA